MTHEELQVRLEQIRQRIAGAAQRAGRVSDEITFVAAAKTVSPETTLIGTQIGIEQIGENRVQEAHNKVQSIPGLRHAATWHLIGHLQTNKVRRALELFDVIQTVDSRRLAHQLDRVAGELGRIVPIYIEVNLGVEPSKSGVLPDQLFPLVETVSACPHIRLDGLMAVPPYIDDLQATRSYFRKLRELKESINQRHFLSYDMNGLSMGMSHDFEVAIEEGATMIRIGTALWGARPTSEGVV